MDVISCEDENLHEIELSDRYQQMYEHMNTCLDDREKQVIALRYGLGGGEPLTQREIAGKYGISRSYVSRIEKKALHKLEEAFGGKQPW